MLRKTAMRTGRFLSDALAWRPAGRQNGLVAWSLIGGLIWLVLNLGDDLAWPVTLAGGVYLFAVLAPICAIDARFGIIPDDLNLALALGGLIRCTLVPELDALERALEAAAVFVVLALLRISYRRLRGYDGFGFGDVKLLAAGTFWIGIAGLPGALLLGVASALIAVFVLRADRYEVGGRQAVPFGPHLSAGIWLIYVIGPLQIS